MVRVLAALFQVMLSVMLRTAAYSFDRSGANLVVDALLTTV